MGIRLFLVEKRRIPDLREVREKGLDVHIAEWIGHLGFGWIVGAALQRNTGVCLRCRRSALITSVEECPCFIGIL